MASSTPGSGTDVTSVERVLVLESQQFQLHSKQRGLWGQAFQRLQRNRLAVIAAVLLGTIILMSALTEVVPALERYTPHEQQFEDIYSDRRLKRALTPAPSPQPLSHAVGEGLFGPHLHPLLSLSI